MGGGTRVLTCREGARRPVELLREHGGEALVVHLDGDAVTEALRELAGEGTCLARLLGVAAVEREWQPNDYQLDLALAHELAQPREAALGGGPFDDLGGREGRSRGV